MLKFKMLRNLGFLALKGNTAKPDLDEIWLICVDHTKFGMCLHIVLQMSMKFYGLGHLRTTAGPVPVAGNWHKSRPTSPGRYVVKLA